MKSETYLRSLNNFFIGGEFFFFFFLKRDKGQCAETCGCWLLWRQRGRSSAEWDFVWLVFVSFSSLLHQNVLERDLVACGAGLFGARGWASCGPGGKQLVPFGVRAPLLCCTAHRRLPHCPIPSHPSQQPLLPVSVIQWRFFSDFSRFNSSDPTKWRK